MTDDQRQHREMGEHNAQLKMLFEGQSAIIAKLVEIESRTNEKLEKLALSQVSMSAKMNPCPAPGSCAKLAELLEAQGQRVSALETWRNGIVIGGVVSWFFICVAGYIAYDWMKEHFRTVISWAVHLLKG